MKQDIDTVRARRLVAAGRSYVAMRDLLHSAALTLMDKVDGVPGDSEFPSQVGTAATDGRTVWFNYDFALKLNNTRQIAAVFAHEGGHKNCMHPWRRGDRDPLVWNLAADHVVNLILDEMDYELPKDRVMDKKYVGWSVEAVYDDLDRKVGGKGGGVDEEAVRRILKVPSGWSPDCKDAESIVNGDVDKAEAEMQEQQAATIQAATIHEKRMGSLPAGMRTIVDAIARPKLDWRTLVRQYLTELSMTDYSWSRLNRSYMATSDGNVAAPSSWSESMGTLACVRDTSGSVGADAFAQFNAELESLFNACEFARLVLLDCDCEVHEVLDSGTGGRVRIPKERRGGGGTSFVPPFEHLERKGIVPDLLVYLTDCMGRFPKSASYPVIWVCEGEAYKNHPWTPPFGTTVNVN